MSCSRKHSEHEKERQPTRLYQQNGNNGYINRTAITAARHLSVGVFIDPPVPRYTGQRRVDVGTDLHGAQHENSLVHMWLAQLKPHSLA
jgi:hypothetical protein